MTKKQSNTKLQAQIKVLQEQLAKAQVARSNPNSYQTLRAKIASQEARIKQLEGEIEAAKKK